MLALSTNLVPFTPQWLVGKDDAPVYLIRPGTITERAIFEGEIAGPPWNAGRAWPGERERIVRAGIEALCSPDDRAAALDALTSDEPSAAQLETLRGLEAGLLELWPDYQAFVRRQYARREALPTLAAMRFLRGWSNIEATYAAGQDGCVTSEALKQVDQLQLLAIGAFAYNLLYGEDARPLLPQPSQSDETLQASTSPPKPPAAGRSKGKSGPRTRGTRSPGGH